MSNAAPRFLRARHGWFFSGLAFLATLALLTASGRANVPGGVVGTSGTYPAVTLVTSTSAGTVTMSNGLVTAVIDITTSQILTLTYAGYQVTTGGNAGNDAFYWQGQNSVGEQTGQDGILTVVTDPSSNGGASADIMIADLYSNHNSTTDSPDDAYRHFTMFQGSPGIYVTEIMSRPNTYPAGGADIPSFTGKLAGSPFNWLAQNSAGQNLLMPTDSNSADWVSGINSSTKEVTLVNSGLLAGHFNNKYNYAGDLGLLNVTGWCCNDQTSTPNIGLWMIHPSDEYFSCGPKHPEILSQILNLNGTFKGVHFGFGSDLSMAADETWTRVCGPFFLYLNRAPPTPVVSGSNPALTGTAQVALYADALAQGAAEKGAWPYNWLNDPRWVPASGRGTVTGTIVISDSGNPIASASNMWVGVAIQPASTESPVPTDFQVWGKVPQFWTKTDANGNFTIPNVLPGSNYTLFAFGPGSTGQLQSQVLSGASPNFTVTYPATQFSVTVTGGNTTNLGSITFAPTRVGPTAWEIGQLDRDTTEFRHGQDYWHGQNGTAANPAVIWNPYLNYANDFPNGLTYTVGQSIWQRDWNYAQPNVQNPVTGDWNATTQTIVFNLPSAPASNSTASLYLALSDVDGPAVTVLVNGNNLGYFTPAYPPGATNDCMIRMESHGIWFDHRSNFSGALLHSGSNNIQVICPQSGNGGYFANCLMYDYLRLEVPGYVPPAPASLTVLSGNSQNVLNWPPAPGATTYNILRSTTSGSTGFSLLASGVTAPVCGSTPEPAYYADTSATNGTTYYYEVASVNVTGASGTNLPSASGTPSSDAAGIPAAPTGLAATAGNEQAALTWNASAGAAYYIVERSGTSGGPYTVVASSVTSTSCTDTGLSNTENYYYVVAAVNASGTSAVSSEASTLPMPPTLTEAPPQLTATNSGGYPYLTWSGVPGATNYVIQRATSSSGPYTVLYQYSVLDNYSDTTAAGNTPYYYEVAAANVANTGPFSAPATVVTPPSAPATVTATPGNTQVQLNWSASAGATSYIVQGGTVNGGPYSTIGTTGGLSYVNSGLVNGTPYYYVIEAANTTGTGLASTQATATPVATVPVAPVDLTATGTNGAIVLHWTASVSATGYTIYRATVTGGPYSVLYSDTNTTTYTDTDLAADTTFYYVVAATNAGGSSANSNEASATAVANVPQITSGTSVTGTLGFEFNYQITATNNPTSFTAAPLPDGLTVDGSTGLISGTPSETGTFSPVISAMNFGGTDSETISLVVITEPIPVISSSLSETCTNSYAFSYQIQASNNPTSFSALNLPPGLSIDDSTGLISGTPNQTGTFGPTINAINLGGTGTETLAIDVLPPPPAVINSILTASGTNGSPFSYQIQGNSNPTSFGATGLPLGLSVDPSTGLISGTLGAGGTFNITLSASNPGGTGTATLVLTVTSSLAGMKGNYEGLASVAGTNEGLFTTTITSSTTGAFTAKLSIAGANYGLKGKLDPAYGTFDSVAAQGHNTLNIALSIDDAVPGVNGSITVTTNFGTITTYDVVSTLLGTFKASTLPTELQGNRYYTVILPSVSDTDPSLPAGNGYGTMNVSKTGAVTISGKLGDGTAIVAKAPLHADGKTWTLFVSSKTLSLAGTLTAEDLPGSDADGTLDWLRFALARNVYYSGGFTVPVDILAAKYTAPVLTTSTGTLIISGGNLPDGITDNLSITIKDKVTVTGTTTGTTTLTIGAKSGSFSGKFPYPPKNKGKSYGGVIYIKPAPAGYGLFTGTNQTGSVEIMP